MLNAWEHACAVINRPNLQLTVFLSMSSVRDIKEGKGQKAEERT